MKNYLKENSPTSGGRAVGIVCLRRLLALLFHYRSSAWVLGPRNSVGFNSHFLNCWDISFKRLWLLSCTFFHLISRRSPSPLHDYEANKASVHEKSNSQGCMAVTDARWWVYTFLAVGLTQILHCSKSRQRKITWNGCVRGCLRPNFRRKH
jgi:hypothetical protein